MEQVYGIGEQSFSELRKYGQVYVDKTSSIPLLLKNKFYFLSRPRRFGKSLFLSTLEQFFSGNKHLFNGLAVENFNWDWAQYPVVRIDFSQGGFHEENALKDRIHYVLESLEKQYDIPPFSGSISSRFDNLLKSLYQKFDRGVVVLVDEYEKPLLDVYGKKIFSTYRDDLAEFYSVFKGNSEIIRFLFLTGVTRFGHLNIFSGLNNLKDISVDERFSTICGITQQEIEEYLNPGVEKLANKIQVTTAEMVELLKKMYDGYHFSSDMKDVYNPFSLLSALDFGEMNFYWAQTGNSTFLLNILKAKNYDLYKLEDTVVSQSELLGLDAEFMNPTTLLYQSGYLTIKNYELKNLRGLYRLGIPNKEVKQSLYSKLIPFYLGKEDQFDDDESQKLNALLEQGKAEDMMRWLAAFFSKASFSTKLRYERDFQFIVYAIFAVVKMLDDIHMEYSMSSGVADLVVETSKFVYLFEFKVDQSPEEALSQIDFRSYSLPWSASGRKVYKIGAVFSSVNNGILQYRIIEG